MVVVPVLKNYTSQYLVADAIGRHDGEAPVDSLDLWMAAAESWIDRRAGRQWGITSVVGEQRSLHGQPARSQRMWGPEAYLYLEAFPGHDYAVTLSVRPVSAVSAVRARQLTVGATVTTLATTEYELVDTARGQLLVSGMWRDYQLSIDYTVNVPIPLDITLAATQLVVFWIQPMLHGTEQNALKGIKSYAIGQDLQVTYQDTGKLATMDVPASVTGLVDQYRGVLGV